MLIRRIYQRITRWPWRSLWVTAMALVATVAAPTTSFAGHSDCMGYVELARSDIRSATAALRDGEIETGVLLLGNATDMLLKVLACESQECRLAARSAGCEEHINNALTDLREAGREVLNSAFGDATEHLGTASAALVCWLDCMGKACVQ